MDTKLNTPLLIKRDSLPSYNNNPAR